MSIQKHTPGPWHWTENGRLEPVTARSRSIAVILNSDGCLVYRDAPDGWDDEQAANLALIAAAPELLAVAKGILTDDMLPLLPAEYVAKVRVAIAKAEGGAA